MNAIQKIKNWTPADEDVIFVFSGAENNTKRFSLQVVALDNGNMIFAGTCHDGSAPDVFRWTCGPSTISQIKRMIERDGGQIITNGDSFYHRP